jgi:hypothetical protein
MTTVYRGTRRTIKAGRHGSHSYTDALPVALIYSAVPPGAWGKPPAHFLKTSTVHAIELDCRTALDMVNDETWLSFSDVLTYLDYGKPGGITRKEAGRILNYLHNRLTGKAPGGEFQYKVYDPGGEEYEGDIMDMLRGVTAVAAFKRDFWDYTEGDDEEDVLSVATLLRADTFIYVDAPTFQKVAQRIGHDCTSSTLMCSRAVNMSQRISSTSMTSRTSRRWATPGIWTTIGSTRSPPSGPCRRARSGCCGPNGR